ncbi:hypothetical protein BGZ46_010923 [Entomortierella lignicola]|nr:hypothetical protein BGZ46_010923 [Entomortierella lignicola]
MSHNPSQISRASSRAALLLVSIQDLDSLSRRKPPMVYRIASVLGSHCFGDNRKGPSSSSSTLSSQPSSQRLLSDDFHGDSIVIQDDASVSSRSIVLNYDNSSTTVPSSSGILTTMEEQQQQQNGDDDFDDGEDGDDEDEGDDEEEVNEGSWRYGMSKAQILRRMKLELERRKFMEKKRREQSRVLLKPASFLWTTSLMNGYGARSSRRTSALTAYETIVIMNTAAMRIQGRATLASSTIDQANGYIENNFDDFIGLESLEEGSLILCSQNMATVTDNESRQCPSIPFGYQRNETSTLVSFPALSETPSPSGRISRSE